MPDVTEAGLAVMEDFVGTVRRALDVSLISILTWTPAQIAQQANEWGVSPYDFRRAILVEAIGRGLVPAQEGPCPT